MVAAREKQKSRSIEKGDLIKMHSCREKDCSKCNRKLCIHNIPLLSSLDEEEIDKFSEFISTHIYQKGEIIFEEGQKANKLFIICSGQAKVFQSSIEGKEQILYLLTEGDFFGAFNLLKEDEFDSSCVALERSQISTLEKSAFDEIVVSNPKITLKIFEKAYERIRKAETLVARLSSGNPDAKVLALLYDLAKDHGRVTPKGVLLELTMSREELGSYAGIARETMSRKLKMFQEAGLIQLIGAKKILIHDIAQLRAMMKYKS